MQRSIVRADGSATWSAVRGVMIAAMRAYVWRLSFVGLVDGREVEIGVAYDKPTYPPSKPPALTPVPDRGPSEGRELLKSEREIDLSDTIEDPIFVNDEASEVMDAPTNDTRVEITDIPLVGPGLGTRPVFGFRRGGGRKRAALRGGGSRASERAVDAAHVWLARNQEPDGRWSSAEHGGAEGLDVAVTGLATLSFVAVGRTEKTGRHKEVVQKAVAWLVMNQTDDGCLADDAAKRAGRTGTSHAIAALALAEAFGMARVARTGRAAQRAVDYSIGVHQSPYSGWGEKPKGNPDTLVTGWFTAQLRMAMVAGLRVEGRGFQGSVKWLDKVTDMPRGDAEERVGPASVMPGFKPTPTATAVATVARQIMGWKRADPIVGGGSDFVLANLLESDARKLDREFLYWGALAMFQMGGRHWREWNARTRDMLIMSQQNDPDDPAVDGSWAPVAADADLGRAGATALASMCLEVYYRYLPLYKKSSRGR